MNLDFDGFCFFKILYFLGEKKIGNSEFRFFISYIKLNLISSCFKVKNYVFLTTSAHLYVKLQMEENAFCMNVEHK